MDNKSIKILVVDDEQGIIEAAEMILEFEGFTVFTATDGGEALDIFKKEKPHMAILDAHLGYSKIYGMEVLEKIKGSDKEVECVMVTRITDAETKEKAKALGVEHYLEKPMDTEEWLGRVKEVIEKIKQKN